MGQLTLSSAFLATEAPDVAGSFRLSVHRAGSLRTSGRIGAADPLTSAGIEPFSRPVPAGSWPVDLLLGSTSGDTRVLLARVAFSVAQVARWELAVRDGQDVRGLRADERFGYPVDAGTGCFADAGATLDGAVLLDALALRPPTWSCAVADGGAVVAFTSGYGDGLYSSYWGLAADGSPACLVTDFNVLELELPEHGTDLAFRAAEARQIYERLLAALPRVEEEEGPCSRIARELATMAEAGAALLPDLLDRLAAAAGRAEVEVLARAAGGSLGTPDTDDFLASRVDTLSDRALRAVLGTRRRPRQKGPPPPRLVAALVARWPRSDRALRSATLRFLGGGLPGSLPDGLAALCLEELRAAATAPAPAADPFAETDDCAFVSAALEPWRVEGFADGVRGAAAIAPPELVEAALALALRPVGPGTRELALQVVRVQGRDELLAPLLASPDRALAVAVALQLSRGGPSARAAAAVLREALADPSTPSEEKLTLVSHLPDDAEKADAYLALGLAGERAAPIQLGYLADRVPERVLAALERLGKDAPGLPLRTDALQRATQLRRRIEGKRPLP